MSLTADQITAQNFKDFYNHIMPYLNGQPALNYSTDEQIIGTWIDGKPLYQKTVAVTTKSSSGWSSGAAHGIANIDKIINLNCVVPTSSGWTYTVGKSEAMSIMCSSDSTEVSVYADHQDLLGRQVYVTIQYIKTTD